MWSKSPLFISLYYNFLPLLNLRSRVYIRLLYKSVAFFNSTVGFLGLERSTWFEKAYINGSQWSSLQSYRHWETASLSVGHCAHRCFEHQLCLSFNGNKSSGICQLFGLGVDIRSEKSSGTITAYTKQGYYILIKNLLICQQKLISIFVHLYIFIDSDVDTSITILNALLIYLFIRYFIYLF